LTESDRQQALHYLQSHQVMTLATVGPEGPWATAVFYANVDFNLIFLSAGHTRHAQNFNHQPKISAAIQEDYHDWPAIKGIQLEGDVWQLSGVERITAVAQYKKKYPFLANANAQVMAALTKVNWYQLAPSRFYFIDNSQGFGHRVEITL
jgi:uncharacterized protein YhbP (UPF0306 family)